MATRLRVTRSYQQNRQGLELLRLALWVEGGEHDHVTVVSGQPGRQEFRLGGNSQPGSMEPIPEGYYRLGSVWWAGEPGDYRSEFDAGLGPVFIDIFNAPGNKTRRAELGIHADWNEVWSQTGSKPGTAGCLGVQGEKGQRDLKRLKKVINWMDDFHVRDLEVDYNLGSVRRPQ